MFRLAKNTMKNITSIILCSTIAAIGLLPINAAAHEEKLSAEPELSARAEHVHPASEPTIRLEVRPNHYHVAGNSIPTWIRLTGPDGRPVTFGQLEVAHTKKIHLLIVDESLSDYQHAHPDETDTPGKYRFAFNPKFGGRYHVWADVVPKSTGKQEYAKAVMTVGGDPAPRDGTMNTSAETDGGYRFELATENNKPLQAGKAMLVKVKVRRSDGQDFAGLQPLMGAFAHMVGFTANLDSVTHAHPMGKEPETEAERGGPELSFQVMPEQAGYLKLYVQTQIRGLNQFAVFGLNVDQPAFTRNPPRRENVFYQCPMHHEVTQSTPGNCSKCGMKLITPRHAGKPES